MFQLPTVHDGLDITVRPLSYKACLILFKSVMRIWSILKVVFVKSCNKYN